MAAWLIEVTGFEPENMDDFLKAVQLTAVLRGTYQRSPRNKSRSTYRPLNEVVVQQRSAHMIQAHVDAKAFLEANAPKEPAKKAAPKATTAKATAKKAAPAKPAARTTRTRRAAAPKA